MIESIKLTKVLRHRQPNRPARKRRGQAIIEMAVVMVVLLTLTFGMVDFSLFLSGHIQVTSCAREVARQAVVRQDGALTKCDGQLGLFEIHTVTISPSDYKNANTGDPLTVTVTGTYRWKALAPIVNAFFPGTLWPATHTTTTKVTMRMEGRRP